MFQEILSVLRDMLPDYLTVDPLTGEFSTLYSNLTVEKPAHHRGSHVQFIFYFVERIPSYHLLSWGKETNNTGQSTETSSFESSVVITIDDTNNDKEKKTEKNINMEESEEQNPNELVRKGFVSEVIPTKNCAQTLEKNQNTVVEQVKHVLPKRDPMDYILPNCKVWSKYSAKTLTPHTLAIVTFPPNVDYKYFLETKKVDPKVQQQTISHYFGSQTLPKSDQTLLKKRKRATGTEDNNKKKTKIYKKKE